MYKQNANKDRNLKWSQKEILQLKSAVTKVKIWLEGFKSRFEQEESVNLEDRTTGIINSEDQKQKRLKKSDHNLGDL